MAGCTVREVSSPCHLSSKFVDEAEAVAATGASLKMDGGGGMSSSVGIAPVRLINAPELLDQLEHIARGLPAKLIGHPAGKRVKRIFRIRLRTAALEQRREPAREQRLGLPARERLEPHGERAETVLMRSRIELSMPPAMVS